jgi:hypothetical protein
MDRRAAALYVAALALLFSLGLGAALAQPAHSAQLWAGDYETGDFHQWAYVEGPPSNATIVTDPLHQGRYAARFRVSPGDKLVGASGERSEVYIGTHESEGTESWWAWSTYFGDDFNPNPGTSWNIFTQWHASGIGQSNAHFEVDTSQTPWKIQLRAFGGQPDQNQRRYPLADFQPNHWFDFVLHVRWASDNTGFFEVWVDGRPVLTKTFGPTLYAGQSVYLKQGFYRGESALTTVLYQDGMRRGDSLAAVAPELATATTDSTTASTTTTAPSTTSAPTTTTAPTTSTAPSTTTTTTTTATAPSTTTTPTTAATSTTASTTTTTSPTTTTTPPPATTTTTSTTTTTATTPSGVVKKPKKLPHSALGFAASPRLMQSLLVVSARAPVGRKVQLLVRGPKGRLLGRKWQRATRLGHINTWVQLHGLTNQRFVRVTLVLRRAKDAGPARATTKVRLRRR